MIIQVTHYEGKKEVITLLKKEDGTFFNYTNRTLTVYNTGIFTIHNVKLILFSEN